MRSSVQRPIECSQSSEVVASVAPGRIQIETSLGMASAYNDESLALAQLTVGRDYYQQAIRLLQPAMQAQTGPSRMLASETVREGTQAGQKTGHTQHNRDKHNKHEQHTNKQKAKTSKKQNNTQTRIAASL